MMHLFMVLVSLGITSMLLLSAITYINPRAEFSSEWASRMEPRLYELTEGFNNYVTVNGIEPAALSDFVPSHAFLPPTPAGMTWSYGAASGGKYACVSGDVTQAQKRIMEILDANMPIQAWHVSGSCGSKANSGVPQNADGTYTLAATYWLTPYDA